MFAALLLLYVASVIVFGSLNWLGMPKIIGSALSVLLAVYMSILVTKGSLAIARGKTLQLKQLFQVRGKVFLHTCLSIIVLYAIVFIGTVFFIIPGIILALMFSYSLFSVIDNESDVMLAFKDSEQLTNGNKLQILLYQVLFGVGAILVFAVPLLLVVFGFQAGGVSGSAVGPMVVVGILVAILFLVIGLVISMINMAGQAYMYLKMREHSPAPKA